VADARRYRLHPSVSLRPERFGALAYSFETRKLSFLKHRDLVAVVELLDGRRSTEDALDEVGVEARRRPAFRSALATLERSGMLTVVEPVDA
jgi:putative mycofactocin binding protein MftB